MREVCGGEERFGCDLELGDTAGGEEYKKRLATGQVCIEVVWDRTQGGFASTE
jgi:hypothetical protein